MFGGDTVLSSPVIQELAVHASFFSIGPHFPTSFNLPSLHHFAFHWSWATAKIQPLLEGIPYEQIQCLNLFGNIHPFPGSRFNPSNDFVLSMSLFFER